MSVAERIGYLQIFKKTISEIGSNWHKQSPLKPVNPCGRSLGEVDAMASKVSLSVEARQDRRKSFRQNVDGVLRAVHYRPIGVVAVLGPYNMPGHIPNGHIIPALLKAIPWSSNPANIPPWWERKSPNYGMDVDCLQVCSILFRAAVKPVGGWLRPRVLTGCFLPGSYETGKTLHRIFGGHPEKMLALELGGNNPLVVFEIKDVDAAVMLSLLSAYLTTGQRCTCARRLIVQNDTAGDLF